MLVATVGPVRRSGAAPAAEAAIAKRAHYIDSTGEPPFIRRRVRELRAAGGGGGHRHAHGVRLRLGARQPGRRARAAGGRRGGHAGGHRLLHHRQRGRRHERRHEGLAGGSDQRPELRLARRSAPHRARRRSLPHVRAARQEAARSHGGQLGALRAAPLPSRPARGERLPRLVRAGVPGDAGQLAGRVGRVQGSRARGPLRRRDGSVRQGVHRRPRRRGAGPQRLAHRGRGVRRLGHAARRGAPDRCGRLHLHRRHPRLGGRARGAGRAEGAPERSDRWTASAWRSWRRAPPRRGSAGSESVGY